MGVFATRSVFKVYLNTKMESKYMMYTGSMEGHRWHLVPTWDTYNVLISVGYWQTGLLQVDPQ
jgi:hypothetical protein